MRIKPNSSGTSQSKQAAVLQAIASAARRQGKSCGDPRGFTLLEVMIVMVIMAVISAIAIPAFSSWREKQAVRSATQTLMAQLKQARVLALAENRNVAIKICDGTFIDASGKPVKAWVFDSNSSKSICDPCVENIPNSSPPQACRENRYDFSQFSKNLAVTINRTSARTVFTSRGTVKQTSTITVAASNSNKAITINIIGRAYLQ
jgi:prepilin-type N-terminal cleavage/methylation domain-containing protein